MPGKRQGQHGKHVRKPAEPAAPSQIEAQLLEIFPDVEISVPIVGGGRRTVSAWERWQLKIIERALVGEFGEDDALQTLDHASKLPMISVLSEIHLELEQRKRQAAEHGSDGAESVSGREQAAQVRPKPSADGGNDQATYRLLSVFTNGVTDDRIRQAAIVLQNDDLTANDKLTKIHGFMPFPPTASGEQLAKLLRVSKQAVHGTDWWIQNRKGERANLIGRRANVHQKRSEQRESNEFDHKGE